MQVVHWAIIVHTSSRKRPPASAHSAALGSRLTHSHFTGLLTPQDYSLHRITLFTGLLTQPLHRITHFPGLLTPTATSQDYSLTEPFHRITHSHSHFTGLPAHSLTQPLHRITHSLTHTATSQDYSLTHSYSHFTGLLTHSLIQPLHRIIHSLKELECQEGQIPRPKYAHSHKPQFLKKTDTNPRRPMKPEGCWRMADPCLLS